MIRRILFAAVLMLAALFAIPLESFAQGPLKGVVADAATGLPLAGVHVTTIGPTSATVTTDFAGNFEVPNVSDGTYTLEATLGGYEPTLSEEFIIGKSPLPPLTLAMQRATGTTPRTLGRTTITASRSLQKTAVIYQQVSGNTMLRQGITRAADAVRRLPAVDNASSDTATFGDDVTLSIRGIGTLETVSLLDGHPIALGISGLNWNISPSFGLRAVNVVYGSGGSELYGVDAIGGVADMQTLEPTREPAFTYTQGWGTFEKLSSIFQATGPLGTRWSYALATGTSGQDGPVKQSVLVEPGAAFDITATDPRVIAASAYRVDSSIANRGLLAKLRYNFTPSTHLTAVATGNYYYDNKTGNGDNDYLPFDTALALANLKLNGYVPANNSPPFTALNPPNCPAGTFVGVGPGGNAYGFGLDGVTPDGGQTCVTPAQWANFNAGWQGAGPAWQGFTLSDYQLRFDTTVGKNTININGFSDKYTHVYDRTWQLPFVLNPTITNGAGNPDCPCILSSNPAWHNEYLANAGFVATDSIAGENNDFGFGSYYDNDASKFTNVGIQRPSPIAHETSFFIRDVYHPIKSPVTAYLSAYAKHSTVTNTSSIDPRIALVASKENNVYRLAFGEVTTQPALQQTGSPYSVGTVGALQGNIQCNALNGTGTGGNPNLKPERGTDAEMSVGHRFGGDSQVQLSLYTESIFDQLYAQEIPVTSFAPGFFGTSSYLAPGSPLVPFANAVSSFCGISAAQALSLLGVEGSLNIGRGAAEGFELDGRQRLSERFFIDYNYATNSSVPIKVPQNILAGNFQLIPGSQLPFIPIHKYNFALDYTFGKGVEARTETYFIDSNNPKNMPKYNYTDFVLSAPAGKLGSINMVVNNVFQQYADYRGLIGEGYPFALNTAFLAQEVGLPLVGNQASERFGLPFRTVEFLYTIKVK